MFVRETIGCYLPYLWLRHHDHIHDPPVVGEYTHAHEHGRMEHAHDHAHDVHHDHSH